MTTRVDLFLARPLPLVPLPAGLTWHVVGAPGYEIELAYILVRDTTGHEVTYETSPPNRWSAFWTSLRMVKDIHLERRRTRLVRKYSARKEQT